LVDEVLVVSLDTQFPFDVLDSRPLLEELPIHYHLLLLHHYVLFMETGETHGVDEFLFELLQLLDALVVPCPSLPS
jgi:hypothetical protein